MYSKGKGKVHILIDKSLTDLSVDVQLLSPGSHTKVLVECTRCNEQFTREYRHLQQLHNCATHRTIDGHDYKWCNKCGCFKEYQFFKINSIRCDGLSSICIPCGQDMGTTNARIDRLRAQRATFDGWLNRLYIQKKSTCRRYGVPYVVDLAYLRQLWDDQDGCCYYTKVPLQWNNKTLYGAQLDRIVPCKGYIPGNVVWATKAFNNLKNDASLDDLSAFLQQVVLDIPVRCEFQRLHLAAKMPSRARATDAGLDVYAIEDTTILIGVPQIVRTGIVLVVPPGYYYTIEGRSGYWKHALMPFRGIIDATYSGELLITMINLSDKHQNIQVGDRFAQIIMHKFVYNDITEVAHISPEYRGRGAAGFGDSGGISDINL